MRDSFINMLQVQEQLATHFLDASEPLICFLSLSFFPFSVFLSLPFSLPS